MVLTIKQSRDTRQKQEALADLVKEEMVKINFLIPKSLRDAVKIHAIKNNMTITSLIIAYLNEITDAHNR